MTSRLMRSRMTALAGGVAVTGLVLTAAACSGGTGGNSGSSSGSNSNAGSAAASANRPIPGLASCSTQQGTINYVGDIGGPLARNFNPFSSSANTADVQSFVYEPLLQYSLSKSSSVQPWLASSYTWTKGGKELTFQLRHGITWSDGKPFTSADVVFTFDTLKKYPATNLKGIQFSSVQAMGPYTVRMTFASPEYTQLFYIGTQYIVPEHIWAHLGDPSKALNLNPVGTGPYKLTQLTPSNLVLTANPHYWLKGLPCIKTVSAPPYYSNTTADLAMEQGNGNWGGLFVSGMSKYTSLPGHKFWNPPTNDVALYPNLTQAPLNSLPLRQAISLALNRSKIEQIGELGEEHVITNRTGVVLPRDKSQLAPQYANDNFTYSDAKAKSVLTAAGYKYSGATLETPAGKPVTLSIMAPAAFSDWLAAVQEVAGELKAIGISATVQPTQNAQWVSDMQLGHYQIAINAGVLGPNSFYQYDNWLSSTYSAPIGKIAPANFERYQSSTANSLINSYLGTNNAATQQKDMAGLEGIVANDLPVIPLYYATDWGLYVDSSITGWPSPSDPYQIASSYDTPQNEVVLLHLVSSSS
jgi:peptide/nickel transport system substrate-binding protein